MFPKKCLCGEIYYSLFNVALCQKILIRFEQEFRKMLRGQKEFGFDIWLIILLYITILRLV